MTTPLEDIRAAAKLTVDTFASLTGVPIDLQNGLTAKTVNRTIIVPFKDSDPYLLVERQLAHILFQSDSKSRDSFVDEFVAKIEPRALALGSDVDRIRLALRQVIDVLESRRIESLWGLIYPGSHSRSKARQRSEAARIDPHSSLLALLVCLDSGIDVAPGRLTSYEGVLVRALTLVEKKDFAATILVAKWLLSSLVDMLLAETTRTPESKLQALDSSAAMLGTLPKPVALRYSDYDIKQNPEYAIGDALRMDTRNITEFSSWLESRELTALQHIKDIQNKLSENKVKPDWKLGTQDCILDVRIIKADDKPLSPSPLTLEDQQTIRRLSRIFSRVRTFARYRLEDAGTEIDVPCVMESRIIGTPGPCFRAPSACRGFELVILIDRSASMSGRKSLQAERGARILAEALNLPDVKIQIWGFQGFEGSATLTKFNTKVASFDSEHALKVSGYTPIHTALNEMGRKLDKSRGIKQLILITDGGPYAVTKRSKEIPEKILRTEVRNLVIKLKRNNVHTTTLVVGHKLKDGSMNYDLSFEHAEYMFGSEKIWKFVSEEDLGNDIVELVSASFAKYLTSS